MHVRALIIAILGVCALGVAAWFSLRLTPDAGSGESTSVSQVGAGSGETEPDSAERLVQDGASTDSGGAQATSRIAAGAVTGSFYVQVDEVDRCIDPTGTGLILFDERESIRYEARVDVGGAAVFEGVRVDTARRRFTLQTSVPDRACFPTAIPLASSDFEGDPLRAGLSLSLVHLHNLELRTIDAVTRAPIEGAQLQLDSFTSVAPVSTGADGRGVINLSEPSGTLIATAPGYHEALWHYPEIREDGSTWLHDRAELEMQPDRVTSFLEVLVIDSEGEPVPGAEVDVIEMERGALPDDALAAILPTERMAYLDALDSERTGLGAVRGLISDEPPEVTDAAGLLRLRVLYPCRLMLRGVSGDHVFREEVGVAAGQSQRLTVRMVESASIRFTIVGRDGKPPRRMYVHATPDPTGVNIGRRGPYLSATSDEAGVAVLTGLEPGTTWSVYIDQKPRDVIVHGLSVDYQRVIKAGAAGEVRDISVVCGEGRVGGIRGRVVDAVTGEPVVRARVRATGQSETRLDGGFWVHWVFPDPLYLEKEGYRSEAIRVQSPEIEPVIALKPLGMGVATRLRISSEERGDQGARPDLNAQVWIVGRDGLRVSGSLKTEVVAFDQAGATVIDRFLVVGEMLRVNLVRGGLELSHAGSGLLASFELLAGEFREERLSKPPKGAVSGYVTFPDGFPAQGASVRIARIGLHDLSWPDVETIPLDEMGRFALELRPGHYRFEANAPLHSAQADVEVISGGQIEVPLILNSSRVVYVFGRDETTRKVVAQQSVTIGNEGREVRVLAKGYVRESVWLDRGAPPNVEVLMRLLGGAP